AKEFAEQGEIKRFFPEEKPSVAKKEHTIEMGLSVPKCTVGIKEIWEPISHEELLNKEILLDLTLDYFFAKGGRFYETLYEEGLIDSSFSYSHTLENNF